MPRSSFVQKPYLGLVAGVLWVGAQVRFFSSSLLSSSPLRKIPVQFHYKSRSRSHVASLKPQADNLYLIASHRISSHLILSRLSQPSPSIPSLHTLYIGRTYLISSSHLCPFPCISTYAFYTPSPFHTFTSADEHDQNQALWLHRAFLLEFHGQSTFVPNLWISSLLFFVVNIYILGVIVFDIGDYRRQGGGDGIERKGEGMSREWWRSRKRQTDQGRGKKRL